MTTPGFTQRRRTCTKSGGREPAVASGTAPATTIPHTFGHGRRTRTKSGGCQPAVAAVPTPQQRFTRHSHLAIAPGIRSGGRQPAVVLETYLHTRFRNRSADCRPARWRTPLQPRSCNYAELTPPALGAACVRWSCANVCGIFLAGAFRQATGGSRSPALGRAGVRRPTELRLLRCTNAHAQERRVSGHRVLR